MRLRPRVVEIDAPAFADKTAFHDAFAAAFEFFNGYGRNMDAWIDCMSSLDEIPGLAGFSVAGGDVIVIRLPRESRASPLAIELSECTAIVNQRLLDRRARYLIAIASS